MTVRFLPHPRLSLFVALVWLALANEISVGAVVMGLVLGLLMPIATGPFWPDPPQLRRPLKVLEYCGVVVWDIILANLQVARLILRVPNDRLRSRYVTVPLALTSPEAITVLAGTITMTPGTVSAELSADGRALLVHGLDVPDPEALVADIKSRYEARLLEIFP
ncbi:MAG: Na+/H+ antiporter subunit E [Geminicoccaceae bacterium]